MGLFAKPKCPQCGGPIEATGYCAPYPAYRCPRCIRDSIAHREEQEEIAALKKKVADMENAQPTGREVNERSVGQMVETKDKS